MVADLHIALRLLKARFSIYVPSMFQLVGTPSKLSKREKRFCGLVRLCEARWLVWWLLNTFQTPLQNSLLITSVAQRSFSNFKSQGLHLKMRRGIRRDWQHPRDTVLETRRFRLGAMCKQSQLLTCYNSRLGLIAGGCGKKSVKNQIATNLR